MQHLLQVSYIHTTTYRTPFYPLRPDVLGYYHLDLVPLLDIRSEKEAKTAVAGSKRPSRLRLILFESFVQHVFNCVVFLSFSYRTHGAWNTQDAWIVLMVR